MCPHTNSSAAAEEYDRVALARAVYARTKYVLLDDPLSAVVSDNDKACILGNDVTDIVYRWSPDT